MSHGLISAEILNILKAFRVTAHIDTLLGKEFTVAKTRILTRKAEGALDQDKKTGRTDYLPF